MKTFVILLLLTQAMTQSKTAHAEPDDRIADRAVNGKYVDFDDLMTWISKHPAKAKDNADLKKFVLKKANDVGPKDTPTRYELKTKAMKSTGWFDDWTKMTFAKVDEYASEFMRGDFVHENEGKMWLRSMETVGAKNDLVTARLYAPLALMHGLHPEEAFDKIKGLKKDALKKADSDLVQAKPTQNFWFSGAEWTPAQFQALKPLLPQVVQTTLDECKAYQKNDKEDPVHVTAASCQWFLK